MDKICTKYISLLLSFTILYFTLLCVLLRRKLRFTGVFSPKTPRKRSNRGGNTARKAFPGLGSDIRKGVLSLLMSDFFALFR